VKLWYRQPASQWNHGMPIGNGRLGAMIYGGVQSEKKYLYILYNRSWIICWTPWPDWQTEYA